MCNCVYKFTKNTLVFGFSKFLVAHLLVNVFNFLVTSFPLAIIDRTKGGQGWTAFEFFFK